MTEDLFEAENGLAPSEAGLLAALIQQSRLYRSGPDYVALMKFIAQMRHMAPFNAALLHVQKPGLRFAASDIDWYKRFGRIVKEGARPLIILWPFSPVALVYDVDDTEGPDLPVDVAAPFRALGHLTSRHLEEMYKLLGRKRISCESIAYGQGHAGHVRVAIGKRWKTPKGDDRWAYEIRVNAAHDPNVRFATLAHELAHLFLGHLCTDDALSIKLRPNLSYEAQELEAELAAYLVCERRGVHNMSESYLAGFIDNEEAVQYVVRRGIATIAQAAGRVEQILGIAAVLDIGLDRKGRSTNSVTSPQSV